MPKILITGNGFDLSHGLPTRYSDFIKVLKFLETDSKFDFDEIYSSTSTFDIIKRDYNKFELNIEKISELKSEIEQNLWYNFFKNELNIETWIDFENKIEYVLKTIQKAEINLDYIFKDGPIEFLEAYYNISHINHMDVGQRYILHQFKIIEYFDDSYSSIVLTFQFLKKREYYRKNLIFNLDYDLILNHLLKSLSDFKSIFSEYFRIFVFPFYESKKNVTKNLLFTTIDKHFTFNYTPTFEHFYPKITTHFLHGKVTTRLNNIVLGINEIETDSKNKKSLLPFTKYYQKFLNETDYAFLTNLEGKEHEDFIIIFCGHSLDKSDEGYIQEVFNFIEKLELSHSKVIVTYHNEHEKEKLLNNLLLIIGRKKVEDFIKTKRLLILDIKSAELKSEIEKELTNNFSIR